MQGRRPSRRGLVRGGLAAAAVLVALGFWARRPHDDLAFLQRWGARIDRGGGEPQDVETLYVRKPYATARAAFRRELLKSGEWTLRDDYDWGITFARGAEPEEFVTLWPVRPGEGARPGETCQVIRRRPPSVLGTVVEGALVDLGLRARRRD